MLPLRNIQLTVAAIILASLFSQAQQSQFVNVEWVHPLGSTLQDVAIVSELHSNSLYTGGVFQGTADFDPGPGTFNLTSNGFHDVFIQKVDHKGDFQWARSFGGVIGDYVNGMDIDANGNIYIIGEYSDTVDFDPGTGVSRFISQGASDVFIQKMDSNGNFLWAKSIGSTLIDRGFSLTVDASNDIYITGEYQGTVDFDPGPGVFNVTSNGSFDAFVIKLDASGNFIWGNNFGGGGRDRFNHINTDASGNVLITGTYISTIDFDPGPGVASFTAVGSDEMFVLKLSNSGNYIWAKSFGSNLSDRGKGIIADQLDNVYVTGHFFNTVDFDPGTPVVNLTSNGAFDVFILKLNSNGQYVWAKSFGGGQEENGAFIEIDAPGNVYVTGIFRGTVDFDPETTKFNMTSNGVDDIFIEKLDASGNFIWAKQMGGSFSDKCFSLHVDNSGNIYSVGRFNNRALMNPNSTTKYTMGNGSEDAYIHKMSQGPCSSLALVFDSVSNVNCADSAYVLSRTINGVPPFSYSWNTTPPILDSVAKFEASGIYTISVIDAANCSTAYALHISGASSINGFDFNANLVASSIRTGFPGNLWLDAFNNGCVPQSGQLLVVLDSLVSYDSASIVPDQIAGDTLKWNIQNIIYDSLHLQPQIFFTTDSTAAIGDTACFHVIMEPISGDVRPNNNVKKYCFPIINGYDPNDKQVYPQGACEEKYILKDEPITYKIRFQNTGNADAINIHIIDSLSPSLDINTLNVVGKSHEMYVEILDGDVLDFRFDSIQLPDSMSNEAASQGYVIFEITPLPGLMNGTVVENTSEIYFDFNPAVVTNTVSNTLIDVIPSCATGIEEQGRSNTLMVYPNPSETQFNVSFPEAYGGGMLSIFNSLGQLIYEELIPATSQGFFRTLELDQSPGLYLIQLSNEVGTYQNKLILE